MGQSPAAAMPLFQGSIGKILGDYSAAIVAIVSLLSMLWGLRYQRMQLNNQIKELELKIKEFEAKYKPEHQRMIEYIGGVSEPPQTGVEPWVKIPYICGQPILELKNFYGRRSMAQNIYSEIFGPQLNSVLILGAPLAGKTSLLNYIKHPDSMGESKISMAIPIYINLQWAIAGPQSFYSLAINAAAEEIERHTGTTHSVPRLSMDVDHKVFVEFFEKAAKKKFMFLLLLDKFEAILLSDKFDQNFFNGLRSWISLASASIALVIASYRSIDDLWSARFPGRPTSPFANIFHNPFFLGELDEQSAVKLVTQPLDKTEIRFSEDDIRFLLNLDRWMPYELQVAAAALYKVRKQFLSDEVGRHEAKQLYRADMDLSYRRYWDNLDKLERSILQQIIQKKHPPKSPALNGLVNYGFVRSNEESYDIAGSEFKHWLKKQVHNSGIE
jgi:hypothetical protein